MRQRGPKRPADQRSPIRSRSPIQHAPMSNECAGIHALMTGAIYMAALTDTHARTIAIAVLRLDTAQRAAAESSTLGQRLQSRDDRRRLDDAQRELQQAIEAARQMER